MGVLYFFLMTVINLDRPITTYNTYSTNLYWEASITDCGVECEKNGHLQSREGKEKVL